ncbi:hypothetical protein Lal_00004997 [Lupinus albus]|nr:hypothetical protein Lal_00004997 [Lupinus albus]
MFSCTKPIKSHQVETLLKHKNGTNDLHSSIIINPINEVFPRTSHTACVHGVLHKATLTLNNGIKGRTMNLAP